MRSFLECLLTTKDTDDLKCLYLTSEKKQTRGEGGLSSLEKVTSTNMHSSKIPR